MNASCIHSHEVSLFNTNNSKHYTVVNLNDAIPTFAVAKLYCKMHEMCLFNDFNHHMKMFLCCNAQYVKLHNTLNISPLKQFVFKGI